MVKARPAWASRLDFVVVEDLEGPTDVFRDAVKGVDAIIHLASVRSNNISSCRRGG